MGVKSVCTGYYFCTVLKEDGTVWAWGKNDGSYDGLLGDGTKINTRSPVQVVGLTGISSISGTYHRMALKEDGTVWTWGINTYGQLGDGTDGNLRLYPVQVVGLTQISSIEGLWLHNIALKEDGTVWTWGKNDYGQLGDGTLWNRSIPVNVAGLNNAIEVSTGI